MLSYQNSAQTLDTEDNTKIFWQKWIPKNQVQRIIVFQHGIGEHSGRYTNLIEAFDQTGTAFYALDARGHGHTQGVRGHINSFKTFISDLGELIQLAKEEYPGVPVFLLGHSMGGAIALSYALEESNQYDIQALILSSPAIELPSNAASTLKKKIAPLLSKVMPSFTVNNNIDLHDLSHDPAVGSDYQQDPLNHSKISMLLGHTLFRVHRCFYKEAKNLKIPVYLFHGTGDQITSAEGTKKLYHLLQTPKKMLRLYDGLYHETMNEKEPSRTQVLHDLKNWVLTQ